MNPNPPSRTRLPFRRPPPRRATARRGRPDGLPRFTTGSARDAINLRWNYTNEINLVTGEWTRPAYRAPACYVTNARPIVHATFSDAPEPVWIGVGHAGADGVLTNTLAFASSKTPSLSLDLPPGDYALEAYFPRVYDGGFSAAWSTNYLHIRPVPEFARDVVGVQCRTDRRVEVALTNDTFHSDIQWTLSPIVANGPRLFATSNSVAAATSMSDVSNVWVSAGTVPGVYSVTASYPGFTNATAYVIDPVVDINGDFFRSGPPEDDPCEADPVCFTNDFGFVIPCNNNDSDGDGVPDCWDDVVNGLMDATDLRFFVIDGMGLDGISNELLSRIAVRILPFSDETDSFPELRPWQKFRFYSSDASGTETLGDDVAGTGYNLRVFPCEGGTEGYIFVEGRLHGASAGIRLQVSLDGFVFGEDAIRFLVQPMVVLSNLDSAQTVFLSPGTTLFASNLLAELPLGVSFGFVDEDSLFPQDAAELGQTVSSLSLPSAHTPYQPSVTRSSPILLLKRLDCPGSIQQRTMTEEISKPFRRSPDHRSVPFWSGIQSVSGRAIFLRSNRFKRGRANLSFFPLTG